MDSESEFPVPDRKDSELIAEYFQTESQFMAVRNFFRNFQDICSRQRVVSIIAQVSRRIGFDAYIPYLAMNYFDRLFSRYSKILTEKIVEGRSESVQLLLIAICCLTLSAKTRINNFSVDRVLRALRAMKVHITHEMVKKAELRILDELNWKLLPVTPFCFLNHYYSYFKEFGGFKRRCINEIIVQAQGEPSFVEYRPSQIALSAFLTASKIAYPSKYDKIQNPSNFHKIDNEEEVKKCLEQMLVMCRRFSIHIEPAESGNGPREETKEVGTSKVKEIQQGNGKAAVMGSSEEKEDGTAIINGVGTSKVKEIQQDNGKAAVVGSSEEKENGTAIIKEVGISKTMEIQHSKSKDVVVNLCEEENEDEEVGTALIQRRQVKGNRDPSQVRVLMQVDVIQLPIDDKDRVEAIIRRSLEKRKAAEAEEPQLQMGGSSSEIVDLVEPMNFELKWAI